jgi:MFS family permease
VPEHRTRKDISFAIYIEHFIEDLGVSRSLVSTLYSLGTLIASFSLPFVGRQIDRRGPRVVVGVVSVLLASDLWRVVGHHG